ncbi:anthrone oxygenase family protein [Nocardia goodfellowii]|uniref:Membrane protein n=1 Tax=Nocardia goodfellowii TaxID=882446 RepID=A0ABS4Q7Z2_9NOCA|nr:anthrone oxygenase family protein [Nocardia goodfellowii]MBP2187807.1 putative membrane protein [Nocardia goodfellowii]
MFALRIAALVAAALASGLIGGVFYAYAISVMPALNRSDDRTIVDVMQKINVVIINPWFMLGFMGTVGFSILAAVLHLGKDHRATLVWIAVAVVLNVIAFAVTVGFNVPLNDQLAAAGDVAQIQNLAQVRADFEAGWVRWNIIRAVLHTLAFLVLCGALFVAGVQRGESATAAAPAPGAVPGQFAAPSNPPTRPFGAQQNIGQYGGGQSQPGRPVPGQH